MVEEGKTMTVATRSLRVTLDIGVRDLTPEKLAENGLDDDAGEDGAPEVFETNAADLANLIVGALLAEEGQDEMFAGSAMYLRLESAAITSAAWAEGPSQPAEVERMLRAMFDWGVECQKRRSFTIVNDEGAEAAVDALSRKAMDILGLAALNKEPSRG